MLGEEATSAEGVLKMNCKVLDSSKLKKLDKQEKLLAQEIHGTGKGKNMNVEYDVCAFSTQIILLLKH